MFRTVRHNIYELQMVITIDLKQERQIPMQLYAQQTHYIVRYVTFTGESTRQEINTESTSVLLMATRSHILNLRTRLD